MSAEETKWDSDVAVLLRAGETAFKKGLPLPPDAPVAYAYAYRAEERHDRLFREGESRIRHLEGQLAEAMDEGVEDTPPCGDCNGHGDYRTSPAAPAGEPCDTCHGTGRRARVNPCETT